MNGNETLNAIREELIELRRYVRTDVEHVRNKLWNEILAIEAILRSGNCPSDDLMKLDRLTSNLRIGISYIQVHPQCLEGYLDGAIFELSLGSNA